jgi:NAD(P)-dependent dehydrogenase (short-subunit alcohol dehydrogenase family)
MDSSPRIVLVTGASAGAGRAIAVAFGRAGYRVGLIARGSEGLESARHEIERHGGTALAIVADVADPAAVSNAADEIEAALGPIDVWVNNAMVTVYAPTMQITPEEFRQVTDVTYLGQVYGTLEALKRMRPRNSGSIICIGSALAYRLIPFQAPYCAAKAAVRGFVDALRSELMYEKSAIKLSMVHLPAVNTPQFDWARDKFARKTGPVPPIYQPEAVARAVLRAVDHAPREYWLGFPTVKAIVAQMLMPGIVDRMLARAGKSSETTNALANKSRPENLFDAGYGDPGSHGRFDDKSRENAFPFNPTWLRVGFAGIALAASAAIWSMLLNMRKPKRLWHRSRRRIGR